MSITTRISPDSPRRDACSSLADKLTSLAKNQYGNFCRAAFRSHLSQFLVDRDGFFAAKLKQVRQRMRELGTRRVYFEDGCWYWELKPGMQPGEVVEL